MPARLRYAAILLALSLGYSRAVLAQSQCPPSGIGAIPNIHTVAISPTSWTIGWDAPAGAPAGTVYDVYEKTAGDYCALNKSSASPLTSTTANQYTIATTTPDIAYGLYVGLHSDPCQVTQYVLVIDSFTTPPTKPTAPKAVVSGTNVTLNFSYTDGRSFEVEIFRTGSDGLFHFLNSVQTCSGDPKSYTDSNVPAGVYQYVLGVYDAVNISTQDVFSDPITVTVGNVTPPTITSFAASPPTIRAGQSAVLSFVTQNATAVAIDQNVGAVGASGSVTVTPAATTTYTLTAMNGAQTATATATVNVITAPSVAVSSFPSAMVQVQGSGGGTTQYTLTNAGGSSTSIALTQNGSFFTQSPTSFTLGAGASQTVTITGTAQAAGVFEGASIPSGSGVPSNLQIPIKVLSTSTPAGPVSAAPTTNRVDVAGVSGTSPSGTVSFTNSGSATLTGVLVSDVPWLIPQSGIVSIPPGTTASFSFTIDRTKRGDASALIGSAAGTISLVYLSGPAPLGKWAAPSDTTAPSVSTVSVVDTVQPAVGSLAAPALSAGEVALFVPGVGHVTGSVGLFISDLSILNPPGNHPVSDLKLYYLPTIGGTAADQKSTAMPSISTVNVAVADVVKNVFGSSAQLGTLQLRSADAAKLSVSAAVFVVDKPGGTFGNSIPIFRSDRGVSGGGALVLSGIQKSSTSHTNIFIQETSGAGPVSVSTQYLAADGSSLGTSSDTVNPFSLALVSTTVPAGAVAAIMTNTGATGGSFLAYATPVDELSGDSWSVVDWTRQYGYSGSAPVVIPVAGVQHGANNTFFRTDVAITNSGSSTASGTLRYVSRSGTTASQQITLGARQSNIISDVVGTTFNIKTDDVGYLLFTPVTGTFAMTSRTYTTVAGQAATFGTGVPRRPQRRC